jgi:hypothetical protein
MIECLLIVVFEIIPWSSGKNAEQPGDVSMRMPMGTDRKSCTGLLRKRLNSGHGQQCRARMGWEHRHGLPGCT